MSPPFFSGRNWVTFDLHKWTKEELDEMYKNPPSRSLAENERLVKALEKIKASEKVKGAEYREYMNTNKKDCYEILITLKEDVSGAREHELSTLPQNSLNELLHALSNLSKAYHLEVDVDV